MSSEEKGKSIQVEVKTIYLPEQSDPEARRFVFAYTVRILNNGQEPATILGRHWIITDSDGNQEEVQGIGVIGQQPRIEPGEHYQYTSGAILETPVGTMHGFYKMLCNSGKQFEANIAPFRLAKPNLLH